jgi:putative hydrolase of the HAD superfamily
MKKAGIFDLNGVLTGASREDMLALARDLAACGTRLFILSNGSYHPQDETLKEVFEKIYYSAETGLFKPDPRCFELILQEQGLTPQECIYFDDSERNVLAARSTGIESHVFVGAADVYKKMGL